MAGTGQRPSHQSRLEWWRRTLVPKRPGQRLGSGPRPTESRLSRWCRLAPGLHRRHAIEQIAGLGVVFRVLLAPVIATVLAH